MVGVNPKPALHILLSQIGPMYLCFHSGADLCPVGSKWPFLHVRALCIYSPIECNCERLTCIVSV